MPIVTMKLIQHSATSVMLEHDKYPIVIDRPVDKGGGGLGLMGGQHLLAGIGGCFCSTLFATAISRDIVIQGLMVKVFGEISEDLPTRFRKVRLAVSCDESVPMEHFSKLVKIAEKGCISLNTVRGAIELEVEVMR